MISKGDLRHMYLPFVCFRAESNWGKSCLFLINEVPPFQELAGTLGRRVDQMPTTYLGMPFGSQDNAMEIWDGISENTEKKLTRWKARHNSSLWIED